MFIKSILAKLKTKFTSKKWKLFLYYEKQCVKVLKVTENERPIKKAYVVNVWFRKHIFMTNYAKVVLVPMRVLYYDKDKRETHLESILYEGAEINE